MITACNYYIIDIIMWPTGAAKYQNIKTAKFNGNI